MPLFQSLILFCYIPDNILINLVLCWYLINKIFSHIFVLDYLSDWCHVVVFLQWWPCGVVKQRLTVTLRKTPGTKLWPFWSRISTAKRVISIKYQSNCQNAVYLGEKYRNVRLKNGCVLQIRSHLISHYLPFSNKCEVVSHVNTRFHPSPAQHSISTFTLTWILTTHIFSISLSHTPFIYLTLLLLFEFHFSCFDLTLLFWIWLILFAKSALEMKHKSINKLLLVQEVHYMAKVWGLTPCLWTFLEHLQQSVCWLSDFLLPDLGLICICIHLWPYHLT